MHNRIAALVVAIGLALLAFAAIPLQAAHGAVVQLQAQIVATCGAAPVGSLNGFGYITMDANGNWCSNVTGGGGGGSSGPVSLPAGSVAVGAYLDGADITVGAKADGAYTGSGSATIVSILKGIFNQVGLPLAAQSAHNELIGAVEGNGVAGTADTHVMTVQGIASGTAVPISGNVGISGSLPAFASPPAVTISGVATAALQSNVQSAAGTPDATVINIQGNASGVPIPISGPAAPANDVTTGPSTCTTTGGCNAITVSTQGSGSTGLIVSGSGTGMSFTIQGSVDGADFVNIAAYNQTSVVAAGTALTANGTWQVCPAGFKSFRTLWTGLTGGTVTITENASAGSCPTPQTSGGGQATDLVAVANAVPQIGNGTAGSGTLRVANAINGTATVAISVSTSTVTQLVALSSGKAIYVLNWSVIAAGTDNVTWEYGTGSNCGTGTTAISGAYPLAANGGIVAGNGAGTVLFVPASNALCVSTSAAVQLSGSLSYYQF